MSSGQSTRLGERSTSQRSRHSLTHFCSLASPLCVFLCSIVLSASGCYSSGVFWDFHLGLPTSKTRSVVRASVVRLEKPYESGCKKFKIEFQIGGVSVDVLAEGAPRGLRQSRQLRRIHDSRYNMMLHDCLSSCYAHLLSNLHTYRVVAAGVRSSSPLDLAASPLALQSQLMFYRTFHPSRSSPVGK